MENNIKQNLTEAFIDVRRAYRLAAQLQSRLQELVFYRRSQTQFANSDYAGYKLFSNPIYYKHQPSLNIQRSLCAWDFLYGYAFEYYFANPKIDSTECAMSVITICDDGFYISKDPQKSATEISSYAPENSSNSWIIFAYGGGKSDEIWMNGENQNDFLTKILSRDNEFDIYHKNSHTFIWKKYPMQSFNNQAETDKLLRDFAELVKNKANVCILNATKE